MQSRRSSQRLAVPPASNANGGENSILSPPLQAGRVGPLQAWEVALERFQTVDGRGWGVRTTLHVPKRTVLLEYRGVLLSASEGAANEQVYRDRGDMHSYTYWFRLRTAVPALRCLDATSSAHISRYINHSRKHANLVPRLEIVQGQPRIFFKTKVDLEPGMELLFDYGDTRAEAVAAHPWLLE